MLIPQFSVRWLLALVAVCALLFWVFSQALAGTSWAVGISVAVISLIVIFCVHAVFFWLTWLLAVLLGQFKRPRPRYTEGETP